MLTRRETDQRAMALIGAGLARDKAALAVLTEDMTRTELRQFVAAFAELLAARLREIAPSEGVAAALVAERAIRAALDDGRADG